MSSNYSAREALKHSEMVYLLCKFCLRAHNPWLVIVHALKSLNQLSCNFQCAFWNSFYKSGDVYLLPFDGIMPKLSCSIMSRGLYGLIALTF